MKIKVKTKIKEEWTKIVKENTNHTKICEEQKYQQHQNEIE